MSVLVLAWLKTALGWLSGLSWKVWATVAALVLVAGVWLHGRATGADGVQADWDAQEAVYAQQRAAATLAARDIEERHRAEYKAIADRFLKEKADAEQAHAAAVADLRSGALRLRERFRCPASAGMPQAPADSRSPDDPGPGGLQPADQEFLLRVGTDADAVARQLNSLIEAAKVCQQ